MLLPVQWFTYVCVATQHSIPEVRFNCISRKCSCGILKLWRDQGYKHIPLSPVLAPIHPNLSTVWGTVGGVILHRTITGTAHSVCEYVCVCVCVCVCVITYLSPSKNFHAVSTFALSLLHIHSQISTNRLAWSTECRPYTHDIITANLYLHCVLNYIL